MEVQKRKKNESSVCREDLSSNLSSILYTTKENVSFWPRSVQHYSRDRLRGDCGWPLEKAKLQVIGCEHLVNLIAIGSSYKDIVSI